MIGLLIALGVVGVGAVALAKREPQPPRKRERLEADIADLGVQWTDIGVPAIPWEGDSGGARVPAEVEEISVYRHLVAEVGSGDQVRRIVVASLPHRQHATGKVRACLSVVADRGAGFAEQVGSPRVQRFAVGRTWRLTVDDRGAATIVETDDDPPCPADWARLDISGDRRWALGLEVEGGALVVTAALAPTAFCPRPYECYETTQSFGLVVEGAVVWAA